MQSPTTKDFGVQPAKSGAVNSPLQLGLSIHRTPTRAGAGVGPSRHCPPWQRERANRLHRKFGRVEIAMAGGQTMRQAFKWFAWHLRGKAYRCEKNRKIQLSYRSLVRALYQWKANGRTPEALFLK